MFPVAQSASSVNSFDLVIEMDFGEFFADSSILVVIFLGCMAIPAPLMTIMLSCPTYCIWDMIYSFISLVHHVCWLDHLYIYIYTHSYTYLYTWLWIWILFIDMTLW